MGQLRVAKSDVVVVWKLDRLGRSLHDLIDVVNTPEDGGVGLRSLQETIDTPTAAGNLIFISLPHWLESIA